MDEPRQKVLDLYAQVKQTHETVLVNMHRMKDAIREHQDLEQITDMVAVLKKSEELLKNTKKQIADLNFKLQEIVCKMYMQQGNIGEPIRTPWVTGTPDIKVKPSLPTHQSNPKVYANMCRDLGYPVISKESIGGEIELFRPHYPGLQEYLGKLQELGQPLPAWVDTTKSGSEFSVRCLWKRDVDLDSLSFVPKPVGV